jgi:hypothetical protein
MSDPPPVPLFIILITLFPFIYAVVPVQIYFRVDGIIIIIIIILWPSRNI